MASAEAGAAGAIEVEVAFGDQPRNVALARLSLPAGSCIADALRASPWPAVQRLEDVREGTEAATWTVGVWGHPQPLDHVLRADDRVEIWRPLVIDPKDARRERSDRAGGIRELRKRQLALRTKRVG
jgi:putative ubiquitin-RnfH superfamily antitoxin RatB of RatAB toxin-antitoxin module